MNGYSKIIIAGNLTRDPETRYLPSGQAIASFDVAVNRKWKADGEAKEEVSFVPITAFGKQAETIAQYLKKGRPILLEGRIRQESWTDKATQQKRSKIGVVLESFTFLDGGQDHAQSAPAMKEKPATQPEDGADDVPF